VFHATTKLPASSIPTDGLSFLPVADVLTAKSGPCGTPVASKRRATTSVCVSGKGRLFVVVQVTTKRPSGAMAMFRVLPAYWYTEPRVSTRNSAPSGTCADAWNAHATTRNAVRMVVRLRPAITRSPLFMPLVCCNYRTVLSDRDSGHNSNKLNGHNQIAGRSGGQKVSTGHLLSREAWSPRRQPAGRAGSPRLTPSVRMCP
jgi:hypothetical protein